MLSIAELRKRNPILNALGLLHLGLAAVMLVLMLIDNTQVLGVNRWMKPFKFDVSVAIYAFTFAWISYYLPPKWTRRISRQIALCMLLEITLVTLQAARGVKSHFNRESIDGGIIYAVMGIFIMYNTVLVLLITIKFFRLSFDLPKLYLRGIQLGLVSFLLGSFLGMYMSSSPGHTVGAIDGGPGLPFLNWSTQFGDLRVMHFIGLHGLQIFILKGAWLAYRSNFSEKLQLRILYTFFAIFVALIFITFCQALQASPLISMP